MQFMWTWRFGARIIRIKQIALISKNALFSCSLQPQGTDTVPATHRALQSLRNHVNSPKFQSLSDSREFFAEFSQNFAGTTLILR